MEKRTTMGSYDATNRALRLSYMLDEFRQGRAYTVRELAERLGVSSRSIQREWRRGQRPAATQYREVYYEKCCQRVC